MTRWLPEKKDRRVPTTTDNSFGLLRERERERNNLPLLLPATVNGWASLRLVVAAAAAVTAVNRSVSHDPERVFPRPIGDGVMSLNRLEHLWRKLHGGFVTPRGDSAGTDELADGPVDFGDGPGPVRKRIRSMSPAPLRFDLDPDTYYTPLSH